MKVPGYVKPIDLTNDLIAFENGELEDAQIVALFQHLINTGLAWSLQGMYGRNARALIEAGLCSTPSGKRLREVAS
jgi:hypothetical protein